MFIRFYYVYSTATQVMETTTSSELSRNIHDIYNTATKILICTFTGSGKPDSGFANLTKANKNKI